VVVFVAIGTLGAEKLGEAGETGIAAAAEGFMPPIPILGDGAALIVFGAVFSTLSALNAVVLASSRVVFAMGRENQLPDPIGQISARYGTPITSVAVCAVIMLVSVTLLPIQQVGRVSSFFFLISFVVVNYSVIRLRRQRPDMQRPFEMPFYPAVPALGILLNLVLAYFLLRDDPVTLFIGLGWLAAGGITYMGLQWYKDGTLPTPSSSDVTAPAEGAEQAS